MRAVRCIVAASTQTGAIASSTKRSCCVRRLRRHSSSVMFATARCAEPALTLGLTADFRNTAAGRPCHRSHTRRVTSPRACR